MLRKCKVEGMALRRTFRYDVFILVKEEFLWNYQKKSSD